MGSLCIHAGSCCFIFCFMLLLLFSHSVMSSCLQTHGLQHSRLSCPSPSCGACSNSCPLSRRCHPTIHLLSSPSPPALNLSQHQGLFHWVGSLHQVAKVLELQFQNSPSNEYSGLISFRTDYLDLLEVQGLSRVFSNIIVQKHQFFGAQTS